MAEVVIAQSCKPIHISEFFREDRRFTGVYFLFHKGALVYVGQAKTIQWRIDQHLAEGIKQFDHISFIRCDVKDLNAIEHRHIRQHAPKYNRCKMTLKARRDGNWRPSRKTRWTAEQKLAAKAS